MSVAVSALVWANGPTKAADRLMLLAIADNSDDYGLAWPGMERLAAKCCVGPDAARATVRRLEAAGWLSTIRGGGGAGGHGVPNRYQINLGMLRQQDPPVEEGDRRRTPPWTPEDPPVDAGRTPPWTGGEPSVEPSVEPSGASDGLFDTPPAAPKASRRKPKRPYPDDFRPTEAHRAKARELGVDLAVEGPKFRDYHLAHDSRHADWSAALHLWIRNAAEFARRRGDNVTLLHGRNVHTDTTYDPAYEATLPPPVTEPRAWSVR